MDNLLEIGTAKLSSRGQIVIPEAVRNSLGLTTGAHFVVIGNGDSIILKVISRPSVDEFKSMLQATQEEAKRVGITQSVIEEAIKEEREL